MWGLAEREILEYIDETDTVTPFTDEYYSYEYAETEITINDTAVEVFAEISEIERIEIPEIDEVQRNEYNNPNVSTEEIEVEVVTENENGERETTTTTVVSTDNDVHVRIPVDSDDVISATATVTYKDANGDTITSHTVGEKNE